MWRFVSLAVAVFMFFRGSKAQCNETQQTSFVLGLPSVLTCGPGFQAANNTPSGEAGMQALDTICTTSCAGAVAQWLANPAGPCNDALAAAGLGLWCQPADGGTISRCRFALDQAPPTLLNNTNLASCATVNQTCPATCTAGLTDLANTIGCCYQFIYNNTEALDGLLQRGFISVEQRQFFGFLSLPNIWQLCNVNIPSTCSSATFRDDTPQPTSVTTASANIVNFSIAVILFSLWCVLLN